MEVTFRLGNGYMMKKYVRRLLNEKIILPLRKSKLLHSAKYKDLVKTKGKKRFLLLNTPLHGNLGDQAITLAEEKFIKERFEGNICHIFSHIDISLAMEEIERNCDPKQDTILINGGGYIGTLWQREEDMIIRIFNQFSDYRIVIFPQTVFFEESEYGEKELSKICDALTKCKDITIFARDRKSYEFIQNKMLMENVKTFLVPDIVTYYSGDFMKSKHRKQRIIACFRKDKERNVEMSIVKNIIEQLEEQGYEIVYTDTVINEKIYPQTVKDNVDKKIYEFSEAKLVITDRLHGMLFSTIASTPCLAFDNVSMKVSGCYNEWLNKLGYIVNVQYDKVDEKQLYDTVYKLLDIKESKYNNACFEEYYTLIQRVISEKSS